MRLQSVPFLISSITYLVLGAWVILRRKSKIQTLYGIFCLATCLWQGVWTALFSGLPPHLLYFWMKLGYTGILFLPSVLYHFIMEFTQQENRPRWLYTIYAISTLNAVFMWMGTVFINGFHFHPWGLSAKAGALHPIFVGIVTLVLGRVCVLLYRMKTQATLSGMRQAQLRWVMVATLIYCGGSTDLISNYGFHVFPLSFIFTGVALALFSYAIFRYEFLAIAVSSESVGDRYLRMAASDEMALLGASAAFPLMSQGELLGFLLLGEKLSEESYTKEDILLLRIVANQAALAYQRIRYMEMAVRGARTEMLGEIAGGFAHEIKTPLANISIPAELSYMDLTDLEQGKRALEEILPELKQRMKDIMSQTVRASDKIEAVRQFSKPGQIQMEAVNLVKIIHSSLSLLDHLVRKSGAQVQIRLPEKIAPVRGSAKQLEIVFVNLIKNATEAMALHNANALSRRLWIEAREEDDWILASVRDSGPGIKHTDINHVFEAYFSTKGATGTGMGLFLSQQVIKAHGGRIEVKSDEGQGTEFVIRLPKFVSQDRMAA